MLCANPSSDNNEALVDWENMPLDVQRGVNFLKSQPGISKVILWAHSGGGPLMTFYQAVAQSSPSENAEANKNFIDSTKLLTVRSFLGANAIRATHSMDYSQIDWCSSNNSTVCALDHVTIPMLIAGMGAHYFLGDAEFFYERSKSADKDLIIIEGATHGFGRCVPCEQVTGQSYSNATANFFKYVRDWINARY